MPGGSGARLFTERVAVAGGAPTEDDDDAGTVFVKSDDILFDFGEVSMGDNSKPSEAARCLSLVRGLGTGFTSGNDQAVLPASVRL